MALSEGSVKVPEVMSVTAHHIPSEGLPLCLKVIQGEDLRHRTVKLELVVVRDNDEVVQALCPCEHRGLPVLALLCLTVSDDAVCPLVSSFQL